MSRDDDPLAEQPQRLTHVIYNATLGHVRVRADDSLSTTVELPDGEVRFRRVVGAVEPEMALWLDSAERDYLGRMLEHVLRTLKITPEARAALDAVHGKLANLGPPPIVASDGDPSAPAAAAPPMLEEPAAAAAAPPTAAPQPRVATVGPRPAEAAEPPAMSLAGALETDQPPAELTRRPRPAAQASPVDLSPPPGLPVADGAAALPADGTGWEAAGSVPAPAIATAPTGSPAAPALAHDITFETVWLDLHELAACGPTLHTLAGQASSEIREIATEGIWLYSHGLGREYLIGRDLLEVAWGARAAHGVLVPRELRGAMSYGAATLLAHLPYVDYSADPITLYFPAVEAHPLGTVYRRDL